MSFLDSLVKWVSEPEPDDGTDGFDEHTHDYRGKNNSYNYRLIVEKPKSFMDGEKLADELKNNHAVIVDTSKLAKNDSQRLIDFLTGVMMATNGVIKKISPNIILCTPEVVKLVINS